MPTDEPVAADSLPKCLADPQDCPLDPYDGLQDGPGHLFVDANAPAGGSGTRSKPFNAIQPALLAAPADAIVAVAPGTYTGSLVVPHALTLRGACAAQVTIVGTKGKGQAAIYIGKAAKPGDKARLQRVRITGSVMGISAPSTLGLDLQRVHVDHASLLGVALQGPGVEARIADCLVTDTQKNPDTGTNGPGIMATLGARATIVRTRSSGNTLAGIVAGDQGTSVRVVGAVLDGTLAHDSDHADGYGLRVGANAKVVVVGSISQGNVGLGVAAVGDGIDLQVAGSRLRRNQFIGMTLEGKVSADVRNSVVELTKPFQGIQGSGIVAASGAQLRLRDVRITANGSAGLNVADSNTVVDARRVVVDNTTGHVARDGLGIVLELGAQVSLRDVRLSRNHTAAMLVQDAASMVRASGLLCDHTLTSLDKSLAIAVQATGGGSCQLSGIRVTRATGGGIDAQAASTVDVTGSRIDHIDTRPNGYMGVGGSSVGKSALTVQACRLEALHSSGLAAYLGASLAAKNVVVVGVQLASVKLDSGKVVGFGDGVLAANAGKVALDSVLLAGNVRAGVLVSGGEGATILHTAGAGAQYGLVSQDGASVSGSGNLWHDNSVLDRAGNSGLELPPPPEPFGQ